MASNDTDVFIWNGVQGTRPVVLPISQQESQVLPQQRKMIAISPSGRTVAVVRVDGSGNHVLVVLDGVSGQELRSAGMDGPWDTIGLPDDTAVTVQLGAGSWRQYSVGSLAVVDSGGQQTTPSDAYYCCGFSADAGYFAWAKYGTANVDAVNPHPSTGFLTAGQYQELTVSVPISYPDRFAVGTDGRTVGSGTSARSCLPRRPTRSRSAPTQPLSRWSGRTVRLWSPTWHPARTERCPVPARSRSRSPRTGC